MTAATVNNSIDYTLTPSSPLIIVEFTAPSDDTTPTVALPATGEGLTYRLCGGVDAAGKAILGTVSGNVLTITTAMTASTRATAILTKS